MIEKNDCDAEYWVGLLYFTGQGKPQDNEKAIKLWRKAAEGNQPKAQGALGDLYYQNDSVIYHHCKSCPIDKNLMQAYLWYRLFEKSARYAGEKEYATKVLSSIKAEMTNDQITQADETVNLWKPSNLACKPRNWW